MTKTQVYLTDEGLAALHEVASRQFDPPQGDGGGATLSFTVTFAPA